MFFKTIEDQYMMGLKLAEELYLSALDLELYSKYVIDLYDYFKIKT